MDTIVLSSAYFPPAIYMALAAHSSNIIIDPNEHFIKQTYRSRTNIMGVNGLQTLSIPVLWKNHMPLKDVRISYTENWQKTHWRSILSAYGKSPFFEFYQDDLAPLFEQKADFLADWNMETLELVNALIGIKPKIEIADAYVEKDTQKFDFRDRISPKKEFSHGEIKMELAPYQQVFADRHGFIENLGILDLLFNLGPDCHTYLKESIVIQSK